MGAQVPNCFALTNIPYYNALDWTNNPKLIGTSKTSNVTCFIYFDLYESMVYVSFSPYARTKS